MIGKGVDATARARALQAAALCLDYPDETMLAQLPLLRQTAAALPSAAGAPLARFVEHLATTDPGELASDYVDTFDLRRRCCLYLTYYAYGDTRQRGMALTEFAQAYREAGVEIADGELADHLGVVCEAAARAPQAVLDLLRRHRAGLELLRDALAEGGSAYLDVIDLIRAVLPAATPEDLRRALHLAHSGPPAEEVGLEPFAPMESVGARR
ncbi:MAG: nitrate reductase molybdenum cofactor assembly chaperone [Actinomycetia bacterium]|nr:nitrate reductase molybdenum cofactor assembly chaperone [Actinomycetes bacterium]